MTRLFLPATQFAGDTARILGSDHLHLTRVLRAHVGEVVILLDNTGNAFRAVLVSIGKDETLARLEERFAMPPDPAVHITVAQALGKGDKFEQVIQHGTEVGAQAFLPILAERCVVTIPPNKASERLARWQQIAKGASEQCGRARMTEVFPPRTSREAFQAQWEAEVLLLHPDSASEPLRSVLQRLTRPERLLLFVGPEGGWSPAEVSAAQAANVLPVSLGSRVLRTETAALVAISQILYQWET